MTLDELVSMMAGGAELEALSHELEPHDWARTRRVAQEMAAKARDHVTATELGVGVVGFGWMGQVHARALSRLLQHYPDSPLRPRLVAVADTGGRRPYGARCEAYGFEHAARRLARARGP